MKAKLFKPVQFAVLTLLLLLSVVSVDGQPISRLQAGSSKDQAYAGAWSGTYSAQGGGAGSLSYILSKDAKGQWRGTVKFTNDNGEQTAELKSIRIAGGKFSANIQTPDGKSDVRIEGTFRGDKFDGSFFVSPAGSADIVDRGTWSVSRNSSTKKTR